MERNRLRSGCLPGYLEKLPGLVEAVKAHQVSICKAVYLNTLFHGKAEFFESSGEGACRERRYSAE